MQSLTGISIACILAGCAAGPGTEAGSTARTFNIIDFGAVGDDHTSNTHAIQTAIDACSKAGGGTVEIPAGIFLTGPFQLQSQINLHLDSGATIKFSRNFADYPLIYANFMGRDTVQHQSPITARDLHDVSITGPGTIDGQGDAWRPVKKWKMTDNQWSALMKSGGVLDEKAETWWPTQSSLDGQKGLADLRDSNAVPNISDYLKYSDLLRPDLLVLVNCSHVRIDGPTFQNSPFWAIQLLWSRDILVHNVTVNNAFYAQNGDGIGIDSSRDVVLDHCMVMAGDDNIVLKSGKDEEGRRRHRPTENVTIRDCTTGWGHGGIVLGSETSGDIRNIHVQNITCNGTDIGLRFKSVRGRGGVVEDIHVDHVTMTNIRATAILFDMYYEQEQPHPEPLSERTPCFRNFDIRNVQCSGAKDALQMNGLAELPLSDIHFQNMDLSADHGASLDSASGISFQNVRIVSKNAPAFSVSNVSKLTMEKATFVVQKP